MDMFQLPSSLPKFIAVLRGLQPDEAEKIGSALYEEGIRIAEVTLNSPGPFESISLLRRLLPADCHIGAGTVLLPEEVARVKAAGGSFVVSPHTNPGIIRSALAENMLPVPGVLTPTESILAVQSGAVALKFFPVSTLGVAGLNAIRAVLPKNITMIAVGGVNAENMAEYHRAGYQWFGLGNNLYSAGDSVEAVRKKARALAEAYRKAVEA